MLIVGLTGGIGSGKTTVSDLFVDKGITVVDADVISRIVVEPNSTGLEQIRARFGEEVIAADGNLDRRALRNLVFADQALRKDLEAITHPLIAQELVRQLQASRSSYTLLVSPLLIESGQAKMARRILVVDAPESEQVARTIVRDHTDEKGVRAIIAAQMSREERNKHAHDLIVNDKNLDYLREEVDRLHDTYLNISASM